MELCAQPHSETSMAMEYRDKCNNDTRASCQERNKNEKFDDTRDCQSLGLTMTLQDGSSSGYNSGQDFDLNIEEILTLFQGSRENLNYFVGLWSAMKINPIVDSKDSHVPGGGEMEVESHAMVTTCDPRDEKKMRNVKDWRPSVRVCPVAVGGGDHDVGLSSRVCDGGDEEEGGGGGCGGDDFEALTTGNYAVKQTVLDTGSGRSDDQECVMNSGTDAMMTAGPVEESDGEKMSGFSCGVYGCGQVLTGLASYEAHYHQCHNYVCDACRRVFVSNFLLDVHLEENHDSYFAVLSHRIDMFRCLVESCQQKFRTPALRKDHLVSVHKFPSSFSFHQPVNVKANRSRSEDGAWNYSKSVKTDVMMGGDSNSNPGSNGADDGMVVDSPGLTSGRTGLDQGQESVQRKRVPASICFGRGTQRTFQPRRGRGGRRGRGNNRGRNWFQQTGGGDDGYSTPDTTTTRVDIEVVDMKELEDALT